MRKLVLAGAFLLFNAILFECGARVLAVGLRPTLCLDAGRCAGLLLHPEPILAFYPEVLEARGARAGQDERVDVLLLAGSVLHHDWSPVDSLVADRLSLALRRRVQVDNLAESSHTSRDSRLKYALLGDRRYDAVVVYHGINEVRANNVPPDVFRADYGHYAWYRYANAAADDRWLPTLALPWAARHVGLLVGTRLGTFPSMPERPPKAWLDFGSDIKSAASLEENLAAVVARARERGEPVLLNTFAIHLPADYDPEAFREMRLDFAQHLSPVKLWGLPENVRAGVAAHNAVIRTLADRSPGVRLVDQARALPPRREHFNDVCHLTVAGAAAFADNLVPALLEVLDLPAQGARR